MRARTIGAAIAATALLGGLTLAAASASSGPSHPVVVAGAADTAARALRAEHPGPVLDPTGRRRPGRCCRRDGRTHHAGPPRRHRGQDAGHLGPPRGDTRHHGGNLATAVLGSQPGDAGHLPVPADQLARG